MAKYDPLTAELPFGDSTEFSAAWHNWVMHRKECKRPLTSVAARLQLQKLAKMTEPRAIAMIENSIEHGWIGLYENSVTDRSAPQQPAKCMPLGRDEVATFKGWA
jgi:hypothetical protein